MKVAIIGRSEYLYETALVLIENGFEIPLIITSKESPEYLYTSKDFQTLASKYGAHFIHTPKINSPEIIAQIKSCGKIDIAVSINYSGIIENEIIHLFTLGILNAHGGDLPRYRGNACMAWAIINKEKRVGLCIHKMIGGELDSGNIILKKYLDININTRVGEIFNWMRKEIPFMMFNALKMLNSNPFYILEEQSKNRTEAMRTYPRVPEDGKIDWTKSNEDILRLINASSEPNSGAFCVYNEQKLIIWNAELFDDYENYLAIPGQIAEISKSGYAIIITGKGKLKLNMIEYLNKKSIPNEVFKSIRYRLK